MNVSKTFKDQHEIEFSWSEAIKQKQVGSRDTFIGLKYTFHFGIPDKKTKDLGHLRGRLLNKGVKKISNVVVNFGGRVQVTDEDGLFVFNDIPKGEHYLYIDSSSLDLNDIATQRMPMKININRIGSQNLYSIFFVLRIYSSEAVSKMLSNHKGHKVETKNKKYNNFVFFVNFVVKLGF